MQIIAASHLLTMAGDPVEAGAVAIEDGIIVACGPLANLRREFSAPVSEYPGCALMPGLVNAHTHLELTHFPAWLHRKDLKYSPRTYVDWIIQVIKIKRGLQRHELSASLGEGLEISLQAGTTMVGDILSDRSLLSCYGGRGIGGRVYLELIGQNHSMTRALLAEVLEAIASVPEPFQAGLAPHSPFTVNEHFLRDITAAARQRGLPLAMHLAESREESTFFQTGGGKIASELYPFVQWDEYITPPRKQSPMEWFDSTGLPGDDFHAVHCVQLTPSDVQIVKSSGMSVVLCPRSNDRLDVGRAPVHLLRSGNIPLALGTDSLASNDSLSMWDEMRALLKLHPGEFTPGEALAMATVGGARAIGRSGDAGTLEPGKRGDLLLVQPAGPAFGADLHGEILYGSRVKGVWVGGREAVRPS